jgi:hypothetical protein
MGYALRNAQIFKTLTNHVGVNSGMKNLKNVAHEKPPPETKKGSWWPGRPRPCADLVPNLVPTLCQPWEIFSGRSDRRHFPFYHNLKTENKTKAKDLPACFSI